MNRMKKKFEAEILSVFVSYYQTEPHDKIKASLRIVFFFLFVNKAIRT